MRTSTSSWPAGSGCSISVTPAVGAGGEVVSEVLLASRLRWRRRSVRSAARRGAPPRSAPDRPRPPSLTLSSAPVGGLRGGGRHLAGRRERDRVGGDQRLRRRRGRRVHAPAGPLCLAARSQNAQSSALRAAPGGIACCRASRSRPRAICAAHGLDRARRPPRRFRRSAHRARIRRARDAGRRDSSATTTAASVLAPRLMVKAPAIGQRSTRVVSESGTGTWRVRDCSRESDRTRYVRHGRGAALGQESKRARSCDAPASRFPSAVVQSNRPAAWASMV